MAPLSTAAAASQPLKLGIGGLGAIGMSVARRVDAGDIPGLQLVAVAARDPVKAQARIAELTSAPKLVSLAGLAEAADVILECIPAAHFAEIAEPAVARGRIFMPLSVGQLLAHMSLIETARATGARIIVPSGALLGLDAVRAVAEGHVASVKIVTRKPPNGLAGAPYLRERGISMEAVTTPVMVFSGTAREAIRGFPANVNVAVALSLAGIGPDRTTVEIWADPGVTRNTHTITVRSPVADLTMTIENVPSDNPKTGRITALSVVSLLRKRTAPLAVGS